MGLALVREVRREEETSPSPLKLHHKVAACIMCTGAGHISQRRHEIGKVVLPSGHSGDESLSLKSGVFQGVLYWMVICVYFFKVGNMFIRLNAAVSFKAMQDLRDNV